MRIVASTHLVGGTSTAGETRQEQDRQDDADEGIAHDHGRYASAGSTTRPAASWATAPAARAPKAVAREPGELVAGEQVRPAGRVHELGERRLLHGQERPDLVAAGADDPDRRRHQQHREHRRGREGEARPHRSRTAPASRTRRRPRRSACVVSHREMAASPRSVSVSSRPISRARQADGVEVEDQHDRQQPVAEHPEAAGREQQRDVTAVHRTDRKVVARSRRYTFLPPSLARGPGQYGADRRARKVAPAIGVAPRRPAIARAVLPPGYSWRSARLGRPLAPSRSGGGRDAQRRRPPPAPAQVRRSNQHG